MSQEADCEKPQEVTVDNDILIGMPKSGKPWRKSSTRASSRLKTYHKKSWEAKQQIREKNKLLKEYMQSLKNDKSEIQKNEQRRKNEKKKRDELNQYKTAELQIISDGKKIKKWTRKARQSLVKLPAEIFEQLLAKKRSM